MERMIAWYGRVKLEYLLKCCIISLKNVQALDVKLSFRNKITAPKSQYSILILLA